MEKMKYDAVIMGAGLAGLMAANEIASAGYSVAVVSKVFPTRSHSSAAEGGIAAYIPGNSDPNDDPDYMSYDEIKGGDYLVDQDAAELLSSKSGEIVRTLDSWGAPFNRQPDGRIALRYFGGQTYPRTRFVGDKTGMALLHTLYERASGFNIDFYNEWYVIDLLKEKKAAGLVALKMRSLEPIYLTAKAIIIASGGLGMIYKHSTNSYINTGDGYGIALRAGVPLKDPEFVQFHPTGLYPSDILISEAARAEGGILRNNKNERFMEKYAPHKFDLAPRDIVSRSMTIEINEGRGFPGGYLGLDLTHLGRDYIIERLSLAYEAAKTFAGVDATEEMIPVRPAQHYFMGGIDVDITGASPLPGLFAAGEAACVSVHGANRLGSNSLLETLVYGRETGKNVVEFLKKEHDIPDLNPEKSLDDAYKYVKRETGEHFGSILNDLRETMWDNVGIFRDEKKLSKAVSDIKSLRKRAESLYVTDKSNNYNTEFFNALELRNMLDVAYVIAESALNRKESRGAHYRTDFPDRNDDSWLKHTISYLSNEDVRIDYKPVKMTRWKPEVRVY
ncbi:succinate dehydrogenase flavoprotein subunit [Picrophilus oshimae]|uniref:succinate dehydrogenase n=1 Tax=Picrophilus torridus (strain ATCC 700027 / DSM 9790 / JCM 10055 / NBRC 100828 / KAW 2/3) TaxID=1122961 RepID=Q6L0C2_PICTO|nr:succinate dehydrogenase flavoprotein subunit [Picrophilus oshimae]AAT43580.1 succinate dehydrogenase flavoprotein subunit [Picrophilus oshimae DSM 9789]SMD31204.1 succinate dehydrogenase subunit A [Picrophilus oshimae DSM 9789]